MITLVVYEIKLLLGKGHFEIIDRILCEIQLGIYDLGDNVEIKGVE